MSLKDCLIKVLSNHSKEDMHLCVYAVPSNRSVGYLGNRLFKPEDEAEIREANSQLGGLSNNYCVFCPVGLIVKSWEEYMKNTFHPDLESWIKRRIEDCDF